MTTIMAADTTAVLPAIVILLSMQWIDFDSIRSYFPAPHLTVKEISVPVYHRTTRLESSEGAYGYRTVTVVYGEKEGTLSLQRHIQG